MRKGLPPSFREERVFPKGGKSGLQKGAIVTSASVVKICVLRAECCEFATTGPGD